MGAILYLLSPVRAGLFIFTSYLIFYAPAIADARLCHIFINHKQYYVNNT
jgi:hypothetical protein